MSSATAEESQHKVDDPEMDKKEKVKGEGEVLQVEIASCLVPQLASHNITQADLATAVRVLNAVASLDPKKKKKKQKKRRTKSSHENENDSANDEEKKNEKGNDDAETSTCDDSLEQYKQPNLRPFRKALASCLELHRQTMFQGKQEEEHYEQRKAERSLKRQKTAEKAQYKKYIASTALRQGRVERLQQLMQQDHEEATLLMIPDGHVETGTTSTSPPLLTNGSADVNSAANNGQKAATTTTTTTGDSEEGGGVKLPQLRSCYVCKVRYRDLHPFYDQLCPPCAALNWQKRHATCDLKGRVAVVTGSRVKIGYQTVLKLLRAQCHVVATTRFPQAAAAAFRQEADFDSFCHRLDIYGLDLRDVTGLEAFTRYLKMQHSETGIDILINNACQTVRRPVAYYRPLVEQEQTLWEQADETHKSLLKGCREFEQLRRRLLLSQKGESGPAALMDHSDNAKTALKLENGSSKTATKAYGSGATNGKTETNGSDTEMEEAGNNKKPTASLATSAVVVKTVDDEEKDIAATTRVPFESTGLSHSAAMSQTIILPEDAGVSDSVLPPGVTDVNGQQLDLRTTNSWLLKMEEVSTPEVMECMFVNAIAPFVLNSRLKPLMTIPHDDEVQGDESKRRPDRYIINVSAMEGKFYRYKMPNHPHTNMAKAALNMLTRTSAEDLAKKHRIYMNSVDTGWINDENPLQKASQTAKQNIFQTPIDEVDAAARILDPIFVGFNNPGHKHYYGKFLKDYRETEW